VLGRNLPNNTVKFLVIWSGCLPFRPIAYASRSTSAAEVNYAQIQKDMLFIVFAVEIFHQFVFGKEAITYPLCTVIGFALGWEYHISLKHDGECLTELLERAFFPAYPIQRIQLRGVGWESDHKGFERKRGWVVCIVLCNLFCTCLMLKPLPWNRLADSR